MKKSLNSLILSVIFFLIMLVIVNYQYNITKDIHLQKDINYANKELNTLADKFEHTIIKNIFLIGGLISYVKIHNNITQEEFNQIAKDIYKTNDLIVDVSLAPEGIIKYVYPKEREKFAYGLNLKDKNPHVALASNFIENKKLKIIGPVEIAGKIQSFIITYPIYVDDGKNFWGVVSIPLDTKKIYKEIGLENTQNILKFAIKNTQEDVFYGDAKIFDSKDKIIQKVQIYNDTWEIASVYNESYKFYDPLWIKYFGIILSAFFSFLIFKLNITKRILQKTNKKMEKYINIVDEFVITSSTDLDGNITYASKAFCKVSGYTNKELIGKNHNILRHSDMPDDVFEKLWFAISNGRVWAGEIKNKKKNGDSYWVQSYISPIYENDEKVGYTSIRHDITDKKRIEEISITDGLTELFNRRHFNDIFPKIINAGKRTNEYVTLVILDVDFFKQYNDTYGHQAGDLVLVEVAKLLKSELKRACDYAFRLGGEEFGIVIKGQSLEEISPLIENIREKIEKLSINHSKNKASKYITASFGLVVMKANEIKHEDYIYKLADDMLYRAKEEGRNRVVRYS